MKTCQICKQEIKTNQSYKGTGTGYVHIFCLIGKPIKPAPYTPKTKGKGSE